jgi:hypothetical protein
VFAGWQATRLLDKHRTGSYHRLVPMASDGQLPLVSELWRDTKGRSCLLGSTAWRCDNAKRTATETQRQTGKRLACSVSYLEWYHIWTAAIVLAIELSSRPTHLDSITNRQQSTVRAQRVDQSETFTIATQATQVHRSCGVDGGSGGRIVAIETGQTELAT